MSLIQTASSPPPPPFNPHTQTVTAVVVGGVIIWLVKKVGKPVAEYLDDRSQVSANCISGCRSLTELCVGL